MRLNDIIKIALPTLFTFFFVSRYLALAEVSLAVRPYPNNSTSWLVYDNVPRGSILSGAVEILNLSDQAVNVFIYPVDVNKSVDGGLIPGGEAESGSVLGAWIRMAQSSLFLKARESKVIQLRIKVPSSVVPNEYIGAIMVNVRHKNSSSSANSIGIVVHTGLRVYVTVNDGTTPRIDPEPFLEAQQTEDEIIQPTMVKTSLVSSLSTTTIHKQKLVEKHAPGDSYGYVTSTSTLEDSGAMQVSSSWLSSLYNFINNYRVDGDMLWMLTLLGIIVAILLVIILLLV